MKQGYDALKRFMELGMNGEHQAEKEVRVYNSDDKLIVTKKVKIAITLDDISGDSSIGIYWEECGLPHYKNLGLFGLFRHKFCSITLDLDKLEILDGGNRYIIDL